MHTIDEHEWHLDDALWAKTYQQFQTDLVALIRETNDVGRLHSEHAVSAHCSRIAHRGIQVLLTRKPQMASDGEEARHGITDAHERRGQQRCDGAHEAACKWPVLWKPTKTRRQTRWDVLELLPWPGQPMHTGRRAFVVPPAA